MATINETPIPYGTLIKQPVENAFSIGPNDVIQFHEKWKGQYSYCNAILAAFKNTNRKYPSFYSLIGTKQEAYTAPAQISGYYWYISDINVSEIDAGVHGYIELTATNQYDSESGGGEQPEWESTTTWQLDWQTESYDVYAYCKNDLSSTSTASRDHIEGYLNMQHMYQNLKNDYQYPVDYGKNYKLNQHEKDILQKKLQGKNPIKHYPIATITIVYHNVKASQLDNIYTQDQTLAVQDTIYPSSTIPFTIPGTWQWLGCGRSVTSMQHTEDSSLYEVTIRGTYIGAKEWDTDFYGENAWEFGEY